MTKVIRFPKTRRAPVAPSRCARLDPELVGLVADMPRDQLFPAASASFRVILNDLETLADGRDEAHGNALMVIYCCLDRLIFNDDGWRADPSPHE